MHLVPMNAPRALLSVFLIAVGLVVTGCAPQFFAAELNAPPRPMASRPVEAVEVYSSEPPTRPHVDVREIQVTLAVNAAGTLVDALRSEAAREGCDAIYLKLPPVPVDRPARASATCIEIHAETPASRARGLRRPDQGHQRQGRQDLGAVLKVSAATTAKLPPRSSRSARRCRPRSRDHPRAPREERQGRQGRGQDDEDERAAAHPDRSAPSAP